MSIVRMAERESGLRNRVLRIDHRADFIGMPKNVFESTKVTTCHNKVKGENVAQGVGELFRRLEPA